MCCVTVYDMYGRYMCVCSFVSMEYGLYGVWEFAYINTIRYDVTDRSRAQRIGISSVGSWVAPRWCGSWGFGRRPFWHSTVARCGNFK